MNSIKELMTLHGYHYAGVCNCDSFKTYKYKNGDYEFRWRVNKGTFRMKKHGMTIRSWTSVKIAEEYLNQLHAQTAQTTL